jgi:hypothetical protein
VIHAVYEASENGAGKTNITNTAWVVWVKSPPRLLRGTAFTTAAAAAAAAAAATTTTSPSRC